jgi:membrane protein YqaA with SNARE-associated domain
MKKLFSKMASKKGIYYLLLVAALGSILGANVKWSP